MLHSYSFDEVKGGAVEELIYFRPISGFQLLFIIGVMMVEEEYSDDTFEQDPDDTMDVVSDDFRPIVLYRELDGLNSHSSFRQKSRRRRWTQRDMTNAYNAVKYQGMSLRGAATAFNVPESTLRDRVHGRVSLECSRPGPPTFFTFEEEKKMVDHILFMSKIGYPYTRNQVVELAGDMTKAVGRIAPFKYLNPSQAWFYAFLNRWPDLKNFLFGPRTNRKSKGVSGDAIQAYFEQLDKVITKYGIKDKPDHMWVVDEVSISCENQPPRILPIGIQRAQSVSYWSPTVAIIGAANAAGEKVPPFLIYHGETISHSMMEGAVRGTKFANSPSGWVNSDAFIQWFLKHFRPQILKRPLVLLYDGHLQFISVRVLERAREDGVLLFPLPPHPAYNHCIENTCFHAFHSYFEKRLERFFQRYPNESLSKVNVAPILTHAYERALQPRNMVSLFARLGICPFNNLSTSIGAYLNIPDDYEQEEMVLPHGENGDHEQLSSGSGSSVQWGVSASSPFNFQATLTMEPSNSDYNRSSSHIIIPGHEPLGEQDASKSEAVAHNSSTTIPPTTSCVRVLSTTASTPNPAGKPVHLLALPKRLAASGPHIAIRLPQTSSNPTTRPILIAGASGGVSMPLSSTQTPTTAASYSSESMVPCGGHEIVSLVDEGESGSVANIVEDIEEGEAPGLCAVCCQLEPPGFDPDATGTGDSECPVVDWTSCDYCKRWVHLNSVCSRNAIITDSAFMCALCRGLEEEGHQQPPAQVQEEEGTSSSADTGSHSQAVVVHHEPSLSVETAKEI
ncbi:hypothetical protein EGR_02927 [Echinococcus granulosus]|uniref:DDE superfamily endonuclease CENP B n=1 Tax=Echinococcus granulosus TaxID=6210 RepID=W6UKW9_ECHGR|nr:hypothetical protein EGR_02927 [Echinococcus granulosus]EUB62175.1 hypothetical protein EGR_02927 [Echinococcus granulosus]